MAGVGHGPHPVRARDRAGGAAATATGERPPRTPLVHPAGRRSRAPDPVRHVGHGRVPRVRPAATPTELGIGGAGPALAVYALIVVGAPDRLRASCPTSSGAARLSARRARRLGASGWRVIGLVPDAGRAARRHRRVRGRHRVPVPGAAVARGVARRRDGARIGGRDDDARSSTSSFGLAPAVLGARRRRGRARRALPRVGASSRRGRLRRCSSAPSAARRPRPAPSRRRE